MCMHACMQEHAHGFLWRLEDGVISPGSGSTDGFEPQKWGLGT